MTLFARVGRLAVLLCLGCLVAACGPKPNMTRPTTSDGPHTYAIFLDGTANDYNSETNLSKLRHRVAWQPDDEIGTFYVEGVGAGNKVVGMITGWGMGHRVRQAYRYLLRNYREGDQVYLFGFSRGAYSARILASLLHYGGLPDEPLVDGAVAEEAAARIYGAYKGRMSHQARMDAVVAAIGKLDLEQGGTFASRKIAFMGLWDTVSALGTRDRTEDDFRVPSPLYADQLCNVERAMHALSLDDNRALEFTPVLLTREYLVENCFTDEQQHWRKPTVVEATAMLDRIVDEAWFTGAHSDVGGGYKEGRLDGLSLNWMLPELKKLKLIGNAEPVQAHPLDCAHDAEKFFKGYVYEEHPRSLAKYVVGSTYNGGRFKLHPSVVSRLSALPGETHSAKWERGSPVGLQRIFGKCFDGTPTDRWRFKEGDDCPLAMSTGGNPGSAYWPRGSIDSRITCEALKAPFY